MESALRALDAGDAESAALHLARARASGADTSVMDERLRRLQEDDRARREREAVEKTCRLLESADRPAGLQAYLALGADLRSRVRATAAPEELDWVERMVDAGARPAEAVDAVTALLRARDAVRAGDPGTALGLLAARERVVAPLAVANELRRAAQQLERERRRAAAERALVDAERAFAQGDIDGAARFLEAAGPAAHDDAFAGRQRVLEDRLRRVRHRRSLETELLRSENEGDWLRARGRARELGALESGDAADGLEKRARRFDAEVRREWRILIEDLAPGEGRACVPDHGFDLNFGDDTPELLSDDGRTVVLAAAAGDRLIVREFDVAEQRVRRLLHVRTPEPLRYISAHVQGDSLWVLDDAGWVLELSRSDGTVRRWASIRPLLEPGRILDELWIAPGCRFLWVAHRQPRGGEETSVVDLARWRVRRRVNDAPLLRGVRGPEPAVVAPGLGSGCRLFSDSGEPLPVPPLPLRFRVSSLAPHPGLPGWTAVGTVGDEEDDDYAAGLVAARMGGPEGSVELLEDADPESTTQLATSLAQRASFALVDQFDESKELIALGPRWPDETPLWRVSVPDAATLVQDPAGRHVVLMVADDDGRLRAWSLGSAAPSIPADAGCRRRIGRRDAPLEPPFFCGRPADREPNADPRLRADEIRGRFRRRGHAALTQMVERMGHDPEEALDLLASAREALLDFDEKGMLERARELHPQHVGIALKRAELALRDGAHDEVVQMLAPLSSSGASERHRLHLLGVAQLGRGDRAAALADWRRGEASEGDCRLKACIATVAPAAEAPEAGLDDETLGVEEELGRIRQADALLAGGDAAAARDALEAPRTYRFPELQALARLARAHLALEPAGAEGKFRKAAALATFLACAGAKPGFGGRVELPIAEALGREQLARIEAEARAWLDGWPPRDAPGGPGPAGECADAGQAARMPT